MLIPAGTFLLNRRLTIAPSRPFILRGAAADASRLVWSGNTTEGIAVKPAGKANPLMNDALFTFTGSAPIPCMSMPISSL